MKEALKLKKNQVLKILIFSMYLIIANTFGWFNNHYVTDFMKMDFNFMEDFKYPAVMRGVYYPIYLLINKLGYNFHAFAVLIYALPLFAADFIVIKVFEDLFKDKSKEIQIFYSFSIVIVYISYIKLDLDLIALAVLLVAILNLLKGKNFISAVFLGLAIATKNPALLALPIVLIYIYKMTRAKHVQNIISYILFCFGTYMFVSLPFIADSNYFFNILKSNTFELLTGTFYSIGHLKIYLAPAALAIIYIRFLAYNKVNKQLLFDYLGLVYSIFVLFIEPLYNWYLWPTIFMSILYINKYRTNMKIMYMYMAMSAVYVLFFTNAYSFVMGGIGSEVSRNTVYTLMEILLLATCYCLYKFGIRSNQVYKSEHSSFIIGIGGDSGAGKSTLIKAIEALIGAKRIVQIEADGDHKWERGDVHWNELTHLNPKANYLYRQANYLKDLKNGNCIQRVEYEHSTGKFSELVSISPNDYTIVAGLHPFYLPQTRRIMDLKIYIDTDEKLRRHWKIIRDTQKRGYSKEKILEQIEFRIEDAEKYIYPQKVFSDFIVKYYTEDEFTLGDHKAVLSIKLQIKLAAEIDLDNVLNDLCLWGAEISHDFDQDLQYQTIIVERPVDLEVIERVVSRHIENIEEILDENSLHWLDSYDGFVQMMILFAIAHKMRGNERDEI